LINLQYTRVVRNKHKGDTQMTHVELEILLEGLNELTQDFRRIEEVELLEESLDNVDFLTCHLEQGELLNKSLPLFNDLREVSIPYLETTTDLLDRLLVTIVEIENRLEVSLGNGEIEIERNT
jgi:hypothetical protein